MSVNGNKVMITETDYGMLCVVFEQGLPVTIDVIRDKSAFTGSIYLARVQNIVTNIQAAFVEIDQGRKCFLPLDQLLPDTELHCGDEILVQITKESTGGKVPECTCRLSISGRYCVASYPDQRKGVSNKLEKNIKDKCKRILDSFTALKTGLILRTNVVECLDHPVLLESLKQEVIFLSEALSQIVAKAAYQPVGTKLYAPSPVYIKRLMQLKLETIDEIITDIEAVMVELKKYKLTNPLLLDKVRFYEDSMISLKKLYRVDTLLQEATSRKVWLKSGGYLIFDPTEALTVIDVNSGKSAKQKSMKHSKIHEQINLEAAQEIAYQIRLRNISGIILVDFINMETKEQNNNLLSVLSSFVHKDPIQTDVLDMTPLGLVEMTRKKTENTLEEQIHLSITSADTLI